MDRDTAFRAGLLVRCRETIRPEPTYGRRSQRRRPRRHVATQEYSKVPDRLPEPGPRSPDGPSQWLAERTSHARVSRRCCQNDVLVTGSPPGTLAAMSWPIWSCGGQAEISAWLNRAPGSARYHHRRLRMVPQRRRLALGTGMKGKDGARLFRRQRGHRSTAIGGAHPSCRDHAVRHFSRHRRRSCQPVVRPLTASTSPIEGRQDRAQGSYLKAD